MIRFIPTMLPKLVQKIRRTLEQRHPRGAIVMFIRLPQAHNSLIRNNIYITLLKKLKQKKCTVVNTKMMPLACTPGKYYQLCLKSIFLYHMY